MANPQDPYQRLTLNQGESWVSKRAKGRLDPNFFQRALLKALDVDIISVASSGSHTYRSRPIEMDTSGILFVLGEHSPA